MSIFSKDDLELPGPETPGNTLNRNSPSFSESQSATDNLKVASHNIRTVVESPVISPQSSLIQSEPEEKPGFRAAEAYIRPSPIYTGGDVLKYDFDLKNCTFTLSLNANRPTAQDAPTEIYLPEFHFPKSDTVVSVSGGKWSIEDLDESSSFQILKWWHTEGDQDIKVQGVRRKASDIVAGYEDETYLDQCQRSTCIVM